MRNSQNPQDIKTCDMDMSVRLWNVLRSLNVRTLKQMQTYTLAEYSHMRNVGKVTIKEIREIYKEYGVECK